jgi:hypothetical protein
VTLLKTFHFPVFEKPPQKTPNKMEKKDVTTGEKARPGRILGNFRLRMRAPKGTPSGHVTFGHFR